MGYGNLAEKLVSVKGERSDGDERLTPLEFVVLSKKEIQSSCELLSVFLVLQIIAHSRLLLLFPASC